MATTHSALWYALDDLGAPHFTTVPCSTCRAEPGEHCTGHVKAHQSRVDRALREASRAVERGEY